MPATFVTLLTIPADPMTRGVSSTRYDNDGPADHGRVAVGRGAS
jgi:hypothetical protein